MVNSLNYEFKNRNFFNKNLALIEVHEVPHKLRKPSLKVYILKIITVGTI